MPPTDREPSINESGDPNNLMSNLKFELYRNSEGCYLDLNIGL